MTCRQTPRRCGAPRPMELVCSSVLSVRRSAGALTFLPAGFRPLRTSWLIVGNENLFAWCDCFRSSLLRKRARTPWRGTQRASAEGAQRGTHEGVPTRDTERGVYGSALWSVNRSRAQPTLLGSSDEPAVSGPARKLVAAG